MANEEQVALLKQGSEVWNMWREKIPETETDLRNADLSNTNLSKINLEGADFTGANLKEANLTGANLKGANLEIVFGKGANFFASNLRQANLRRASLEGVNLRAADLVEANLERVNLENANLEVAHLGGANFERAFLKNAHLLTSFYMCNLRHSILEGAYLRGADLQGVDLSYADLSYANLISANLSNSDFSNANLHASQVIRANFTSSTLTGVCIADWQISSSTVLKDVKCDYIFRTLDNRHKFSGRLPVDSESTFALGEFTQRFQIIASALETIDITFTEGIDWQAFFRSFQDLRDSRPDEDVSIQGMERKGNAFVVRLEDI